MPGGADPAEGDVQHPDSRALAHEETGRSRSLDRDSGVERAQRWTALLDTVAREGRLSVAGAAERLGVSQATVRRDFNALAEQQLVTRTHGGVVASSVAYELPARYRPGSATSARERIGRAAADLLEPDTVVAFNGGTSTTSTARRLAGRVDLSSSHNKPAITVVTNALNIASEMVLRPHIRTVTLGGVARPESYELTGPLASLVLEQLWIDVAVLGVNGFSLDGGATTFNEDEASVNALMVKRSRRVIVVAESMKLGRRAFARICDASAVHTLVTDSDVDQAQAEALRSLGVRVIIV